MKGLLLAAVLTLVPMAAYGEPQAAALGFGLSKCSEFLDDTLGKDKSDTTDFLAYGSWAQGFMTGMNGSLEVNGGKNNEKNLGAFKIVEQMTRYAHYCEQHPDQVFELAVFDFYKSLPRYHGTR
ncbi:MAG TPA: hypothetical protein VMF12_13770 [Xanthobacteraceae bacterium]|nr:hypothetical protein [Xanthobacteraceae bacterium]